MKKIFFRSKGKGKVKCERMVMSIKVVGYLSKKKEEVRPMKQIM